MARGTATASGKPLAAEALGAFLLVVAGCGAIMTAVATGAFGIVGLALAWGLTVGLLVFALRGAHFNPAVTVGLAAAGRFPWRRVPAFVLAQSLGAVAGAAVLRFAVGDIAGLGATAPADGLSAATTLALEALFTGFLMLAVFACSGRTAGASAVVLGATVAVAVLVIGPLTGASLNPARSLGPALVGGPTVALLAYLAAPTGGAMAAAAVHAVARRAVRSGRSVRHGRPVRPARPVPVAPLAAEAPR